MHNNLKREGLCVIDDALRISQTPKYGVEYSYSHVILVKPAAQNKIKKKKRKEFKNASQKRNSPQANRKETVVGPPADGTKILMVIPSSLATLFDQGPNLRQMNSNGDAPIVYWHMWPFNLHKRFFPILDSQTSDNRWSFRKKSGDRSTHMTSK